MAFCEALNHWPMAIFHSGKAYGDMNGVNGVIQAKRPYQEGHRDLEILRQKNA